MPYVTQHHVSHNGRDYEPGEVIAFEEGNPAEDKAREDLLACKAIGAAEGRPAKAEKVEKALADMTKAELEKVAADETVDLSAAKTNAEKVAAIEAARAAKAAAAQNATD